MSNWIENKYSDIFKTSLSAITCYFICNVQINYDISPSGIRWPLSSDSYEFKIPSMYILLLFFSFTLNRYVHFTVESYNFFSLRLTLKLLICTNKIVGKNNLTILLLMRASRGVADKLAWKTYGGGGNMIYIGNSSLEFNCGVFISWWSGKITLRQIHRKYSTLRWTHTDRRFLK